MSDPADPRRPGKSIPWGCKIAGAMIPLILVAMGTCAYPFLRAEMLYRESKGEYARRQDRYDAIVRKLSALVVAPDQMHYFFIQADRDPQSLRLLEREDNSRYDHYSKGCLIEAYREKDGSLLAFFVTRDFGPVKGTQGLVYAVAEPKSGQFGRGGRHEKVAANWWAAWY